MEQARQIESPHFLWVAALTIGLSIGAVQIVRIAAVRILNPDPAFAPLTPAPPVIDTFIGTVAAIFVFVWMAFRPNPVRTYRRVAAAALLVSFAPDVMLGVYHSMGAHWPEAFALMIMHVVVWAICITVLPALAFSKREPKAGQRRQRLTIL